MRLCHGSRPRLPPRRGAAQALHRDEGHPGGRTWGEKRPNRFTFLVIRCLSAHRIFAFWPWPRHTWMLVGTSGYDSRRAESLEGHTVGIEGDSRQRRAGTYLRSLCLVSNPVMPIRCMRGMLERLPPFASHFPFSPPWLSQITLSKSVEKVRGYHIQEGMLSTPISVLGGWPTVPHEPRLSTAYGNSGAISSSISHALSCTTTHENETALQYAGATTSLHSRRGYAGAPCPEQSLTRASLQHHHLLPPLGEHAEETCPGS
jgi:hypothetical protein